MTRDFSYDPFDADVMANPLPYYRILRDEYPVYYMPQWDTFAVSRFEDIWQILEVSDGTFVASEGTLPPASVLAQHNNGPVADPPLHPLPFHAVFDTDLYGEIRRAHSQPLRPRSVTALQSRIRELANERLDLLLARGSFDLTQDYGGIVAASMVCELLGLSTDLAPQVLAAVNAGSLAEPGEGVDTAESRPNYLQFLVPVVQRRRDGEAGDLPVVDGLLGYHLPDGSALTDVEVATQMLCIFIGGTETVPKIVAHGLWELSRRPEQMQAVRADPAATVPLAREEMIRYCAPAQWFARTARKPFTMHGKTIEPGQRVITLLASANRDEREYPEPDEFIWDRPIKRSLAFGRGQHFCLGYHLARLEVAVLLEEWLRRVPEFAIDGDRATRLPSSFQWGWNKIPVEV
ncbi:cytochrome P450 [Mycobacterium paragordonae]|uniref:Cytochrome P450 n=2 Tax=Mycobacterium paragordonae TaxID=1389713 RepID=A0ABQ1CE01_9MYCO|nr:cytochrome P450 [Mycobacterium paragordonae]